VGQRQAADCVRRDWEDVVRFYAFPTEPWVHLRTSTPLESICAGVRLRTTAARRRRSRENVLHLVFKLIERLSQNWRALNGGETLLRLVLDGAELRDGLHQPRHAAAADAVAA